MTLVEILLVLALLVLIGSMVAPVFTGSFATVRLRRAGDQVLTSWAEARALAIETGEAFQFQYAPETGEYTVATWKGPQEEEETPSKTPSRSPVAPPSAEAATAGTEASSNAPGKRRSTGDSDLPDLIVFQSGQLAVDDPVSGERRVEATNSTGNELSTPILFFPDGSASQASVVLAHDGKQFLRLTLRGLTGVGRASDILTREELDRATGGR